MLHESQIHTTVTPTTITTTSTENGWPLAQIIDEEKLLSGPLNLARCRSFTYIFVNLYLRLHRLFLIVSANEPKLRRWNRLRRLRCWGLDQEVAGSTMVAWRWKVGQRKDRVFALVFPIFISLRVSGRDLGNTGKWSYFLKLRIVADGTACGESTVMIVLDNDDDGVGVVKEESDMLQEGNFVNQEG